LSFSVSRADARTVGLFANNQNGKFSNIK